MSNGLMSALTGFGRAATGELLGRAKREKGQIEEGFAERDAYWDNMVTNTINEVNFNRERIEKKGILESADNYDRLLSEYGTDQREELEFLAETKPWLFEGTDFNAIQTNIDAFMLSPTRPDISPEGVIRVRDVTEASGWRTIDQTAPESFIDKTSTADVWRNNYSTMVSNVSNSLSDAIGPGSKKLFAGDFIPEKGAKARFEGRKQYTDYQKDVEGIMTQEEFKKYQAEIVGRKLYSAPSSVSANEMLRYTTWVDTMTYNELLDGYMRENGGNQIQAEMSTMTKLLSLSRNLDAKGYDVQRLVNMGVVPSDSLLGLMVTDPAIEVAKQVAVQKIALNPQYQILQKEYEKLESDPKFYLEQNDEAKYNTVKTEWERFEADTYKEAVDHVSRTGYYDIEKNFLSAYNIEEYPEELKINTAEYGVVIMYPVPMDGYIKILDGNNPSPEDPVDTWNVKNMIPIRHGGNPDTDVNLYYNEDLGYIPGEETTIGLTGKNPKFDAIWATIRNNDPFGINSTIPPALAAEAPIPGAPIPGEPIPEIVEGAPITMTEEEADATSLPPSKTLKIGIKGKGSIIPNPKYDIWLSENKERWNNTIIWIIANEPEKYRMTEPKAGKPGKKIIAPEWNAWQEKWERHLEIGKIE